MTIILSVVFAPTFWMTRSGVNGGLMEELREKEDSVFGDEDYQELQEARGVGGVGVCGAGYWVGDGVGAALGRVVGV
jgi:hypothetical protein